MSDTNDLREMLDPPLPSNYADDVRLDSLVHIIGEAIASLTTWQSSHGRLPGAIAEAVLDWVDKSSINPLNEIGVIRTRTDAMGREIEAIYQEALRLARVADQQKAEIHRLRMEKTPHE